MVAILAGEGHKIPGFSLSLWGDVPLGSGLSSSAASGGGHGAGRLSLIGASYPGPVLARLCQRAENEFVGANCGIMDQFISANGKENHALLLDCRDLSFKLAPIPANVALVIANTMVKHSVAGGDYPTRRARIRGRLRGYRQPPAGRSLPARRHARGPGEVGPRDGAQIALRARHVISENLRTVAACEALLKGDMNELGRLMAEAHTQL